MTGPLRLAVIGDSTAFTDHTGPQLPGTAHLYPNVLGDLLERATGRPVDVTVLARPGMSVREAFRMVTKDRHAQFDVLARSDVVVVAVGSIDHAPGGVPQILEALVPFLRPTRVRRGVRRVLRAAYPRLVRATAGRLRRTDRREFARLYDRLLLVVRGLTDGAAGAVLGPTGHRSDYYAQRHPGLDGATAQQFALARRHGFPTVAPWPLVQPHAGDLNPDGIHWPAPAHQAVARALSDVLVPQLTGSAPRPPRPRP